MTKKKLQDKDWWALHVIRAQQDGKDYIFASVRRRYSDDDIETVGHGEYIGVERKPSFAKIRDTDPDSTTFGQRIEKPNSEPIGIKMVFKDEFNAKNIARYKSMSGVTSFGQTEYIYKFRQINISADKVDEFWIIKQDDAYDKYVLKTVIKLEENKPNVRRRNP